MTVARPLYRLRQFANGLAPRITAQERATVAALLGPGPCKLFYGMNGYGQRHALNVHHALVRAGWTDRDLLVAALLHDVAKGKLGLLARTAIVLLQAMAPQTLARLATDERSPWWRPFYLDAQHAVLGAAWVEKAGCSPATVALIREHAATASTDARLRALQVADSGN